MKTPDMETDRLLLRPIDKNDVNSIFNCWMQDEDVSKYMCWKASSDYQEAENFVKYELEQMENKYWNRWIIELKQTNEIIGTCLIFVNDEESNWDISYNLGKKYWGHGYITEAMRKVMDYAINQLGMSECIAVHAVENTASESVIQKLGFVYEKEIPYECNGGEIQTIGKYYRFRIKH